VSGLKNVASHFPERVVAVGLYLTGLGGVGFYTVFLGFYTLSHLLQIYETWYLGYFASLYETSPKGSVSVS
jgi:hypothetical protein